MNLKHYVFPRNVDKDDETTIYGSNGKVGEGFFFFFFNSMEVLTMKQGSKDQSSTVIL